MNQGEIARRVNRLFLVADEGDGWVVFFAGKKVFGPTNEKDADEFCDQLRTRMLAEFDIHKT